MYPNLKFAAPEISAQMPKCSASSDLFSAGCLLYYLMALANNNDPYVLGQYDRSSPQQHSIEVSGLQNRLGSRISKFDSEVQEILRTILLAGAP